MTMGPTGQSIQTQVDLKYFKDTLRDLLPRHVGTDKERAFTRFPRAVRSVMYNDTSDLRENRHTKENREWCVCVCGGGCERRGDGITRRRERGYGDVQGAVRPSFRNQTCESARAMPGLRQTQSSDTDPYLD